MSQEHLGNAIGLTFQQIQKYEKGLNRIGAGRLYRIAKVLSAPVAFFYDGLPCTSEDADGDGVADARSAEIQAFLSSTEGQQLAHAFQRIEDGPTRRRIIDLVNTISGREA
jgi:transcriptional regulator with XRE-family HTH domain